MQEERDRMLRLITDFDGPIMDVSERYYQVYKFCLENSRHREQTVRCLSKSEFWQLKRARVPERQIGILSGLEPDRAIEFAKLRGRTVHSAPYLHYDTPIPGAVEALERIKLEGIDLVVMTLRRTRELHEALERCNLGSWFPDDRRYCLGNEYVKTGDVKDKPMLMTRALQELPPATEIWMVGDTEADLVAAKTHGIKSIGVLSGIRDRERLEAYAPHLIVNNLAEAVESILTQSIDGQPPSHQAGVEKAFTSKS